MFDEKFAAELAKYDYGAAMESWLKYLREVYRQVQGTPDEVKVAEYGKLEKAGKAFEQRHLLTELVETVISKHDDLYERLNDYLVIIPHNIRVIYDDADLWNMFDYFTGGVIDFDKDYGVYFKPDVYRFFQLVKEEWGD